MVFFFYTLQHRFGDDNLLRQSSRSGFDINDDGMIDINQTVILKYPNLPRPSFTFHAEGDRSAKDIALRSDEPDCRHRVPPDTRALVCF
ncbi:MAG: hypothetical protein JWQ49_5792 [Edaphobacter sp.]|nr:hypothetical protein [Edaphobacter sp.]